MRRKVKVDDEQYVGDHDNDLFALLRRWIINISLIFAQCTHFAAITFGAQGLGKLWQWMTGSIMRRHSSRKKSQITWNNGIKKQKHVTCGHNDRISPHSIALVYRRRMEIKNFLAESSFPLMISCSRSVLLLLVPTKEREKVLQRMIPWRLFGVPRTSLWVFSRLIRLAETHFFSSTFIMIFDLKKAVAGKRGRE